VTLRPIRPADAAALMALHDRLSAETVYQRFFTVMQHLAPDWARALAEVDGDRRAAIVGEGPDGQLVGVARYAWDTTTEDAEIALVVQDAWQARGLGTLLLSALLDHAEGRGITRFRAYVLTANHRMLRLIEELGRVTERVAEQGVVTVRFTRRPGRRRASGPSPGAGRR
jgi:RimJ/RimL family protein N-acetyltransferase